MCRRLSLRLELATMDPHAPLVADQQQSLSLVSNAMLDEIAHGRGNADHLQEWLGCVLTWSRVAQLLSQSEADMAQQLNLVSRLIERQQRTGRVIFLGPDYQLAKEGVIVMDALASIVDQRTAVAAAIWSEAKLAEVNTACAQSKLQAAVAINGHRG